MFIGCKWTGTIRLDNGLSLFKGRRGLGNHVCRYLSICFYLFGSPLILTWPLIEVILTCLPGGCVFLPLNLYDDVCSVELIREQLLFFGWIMAIDPYAIHIYRLA
jgi:hypothetical protein